MHGNTPTALSLRTNSSRVDQLRTNKASLVLVAVSATMLAMCSSIVSAQPGLPPVQFPAENQFSTEKSTLGKILFWDEQLSSDNTMSCGTCHIPSASGTDPRTSVNPGLDELLGTDDDVAGSPGVSLTDSDDSYLKSVLGDLLPQTTGRQAQPSLMAMYANDLFWDGRASSQFIDPTSGEVIIESGGALESQTLGPILSDVEMSHMDRDWDTVVAKLTKARPMALASSLTNDVAQIIETGSSYPDLFESAFGDPEINPVRIAMAIATYERTLVPDQSPYDQFVAGDNAALTNRQQNGLDRFANSRCSTCHVVGQFTGNGFRNVGLRPITEDAGRFEVTGNPADQGRFKVPTLRNIALRDRFMHNGQLATIQEVFDFYARRNGQVSFAQNRDPILNTPIAFPLNQQVAIEDFMLNGLTDPRVASEEFPFDRPQLHSEQAVDNPLVISGGIAGSGGVTPEIIALSPPNIGNLDFKVGIDGAIGGAQAWVLISGLPPVNGLLLEDELLGPITLEGSGPGEGFGTMQYPIDNIIASDGEVRYMQWIVADAQAPGGFAASPAIQLTLFCSMNGTCINYCPADINGNGDLNFFDISAFLNAFSSQQESADFTGDGNLNFFDISEFLTQFGLGCP
jgi:cytochrome c peroxidase